MKLKNLFKGLIAVVFLTALIIGGCRKNDSITGPNTQVTFPISQRTGQNGGTQFMFKPSANIKISQIVSRYPAQQFADTINFGNINYVYSKDTTYIINEFTNVTAGQQWQFNFSGSGVSNNNSNYNTTSNYTVQ